MNKNNFKGAVHCVLLPSFISPIKRYSSNGMPLFCAYKFLHIMSKKRLFYTVNGKLYCLPAPNAEEDITIYSSGNINFASV